MSQAGILDVEASNPQIPTSFVTNSGIAVPLVNTLEILGSTVVANTHPTAVETTGSGNTVTVEVAVTQELLAADITKVGLANFDSTAFDVDANGFVTLTGGGGATTNIDVDAFTAPGTDPVVPLAGNIVMTGAQVASGVVGTNVIRTDSIAANTVTIEIQRSSTAASTTVALNGVSHFNSSMFTVDASGFVSTSGIVATSYTTDSGSAVPAAGILTVIGSGGVTTSGAGSTITIVGSSEQVIAITALDNTDSPYTVLTADYYMTCDVSAGALTIRLPNIPVTGKVFIVKDASGDSATNNIIVTTVGGVVNIDGATSFIINTDYRSLQFVFTGAAYEIF